MIAFYLAALVLAVIGLFASAAWDIRENARRKRPWYSMGPVEDRRVKARRG